MDESFSLMIASDDEHDRVFAEIYCSGLFVALISQEQGPESAMIELPDPGFAETHIIRKVSLQGFQEAIEKAKAELNQK